MKNELQEIFEALPIVVFRWKNEANWPIAFVTKNVEDLLGYTYEEVSSESFQYSQIIHPDDLIHAANEVKFYSDGGFSDFTHEPYRIIKKDG